MQTPLKHSSSNLHKTPPTLHIYHIGGYLNQQYGNRMTNLDHKVAYLEKLLSLMKLPVKYNEYDYNYQKNIVQVEETVEKNDSNVKKGIAHKEINNIEEILNPKDILWKILELLGINPKEFSSDFWTLDEAFTFAVKDQLNIERWLNLWKTHLEKLLTPNEFQQFFHELEDLLLVCVMTIDYLRRFKENQIVNSQIKNIVNNQNDTILTKEKNLQVDTIPDFDDIIKRLKLQLEESEKEKILLTKIFAEKVEILNQEIKSLEIKLLESEEKRNENFEKIKEISSENIILRDEIIMLQKNNEENSNANEDNFKKERRKKYALIDDLHGRLKIADQINVTLARKLEEVLLEKEKLEKTLSSKK